MVPSEVRVGCGCGVSDLSKIVTFINMVITGIENWPPDMIPVAFDRKFDEKKDEIPPRACGSAYTSNFLILGV